MHKISSGQPLVSFRSLILIGNGKIHNVGRAELSTQSTTEEFQIEKRHPADLTVTRRSNELSAEEKLALLRGLDPSILNAFFESFRLTRQHYLTSRNLVDHLTY